MEIAEIENLTLEIFENKESYKDNDFIVILNILKESYMKCKGILGEDKMEYNKDKEKEEILCDMCGEVDELFSDDLCSYCFYNDSTSYADDPTYTGSYLSSY